MRFQNGNQYGKHNNHYGRLTKEQYEALKGLVPRAIEVWRQILNLPVTIKGASVQSETASKVINKFVPELKEIEGKKELTINNEFANLLRDIADRIAGKDKGGSSNSKKGSDSGAT